MKNLLVHSVYEIIYAVFLLIQSVKIPISGQNIKKTGQTQENDHPEISEKVAESSAISEVFANFEDFSPIVGSGQSNQTVLPLPVTAGPCISRHAAKIESCIRPRKMQSSGLCLL